MIRSRIGIGRNIYKHKKVETEVMEELCDILSEYEEIMKSYRVDAHRVYAGAFLKDAGKCSVCLRADPDQDRTDFTDFKQL